MPRPSPQTERVISVINLLAHDEAGATMTEIASELGLSQATCVHFLAALTASGFLVREPATRRYHLGPALVAPGRVAAARYPDLAVVREEMDALTRELELPCFAFAREGAHARLVQYTWVAQTPPPGIRVGETFPLVPPLGTMFFAWGHAEEFERWLALAPTISGARADRFRAQRDAIVRDGFVVEIPPAATPEDDLVRVIDDRDSPYRDGRLQRMLDDHGDGEHNLTDVDPDGTYLIHDIGAPVFDAPGSVSMSLNLIGFADRIRGDEIVRLGEVVRAAADRVTAALASLPRPTT